MCEEPSPHRPTPRRRRRNNRAFRLFAANAVSQMGDWFNVVALFSLLLDLRGKGEAVALVLLARLLPIFIVGPAAGVLADRISRRAILITTALGGCGVPRHRQRGGLDAVDPRV